MSDLILQLEDVEFLRDSLTTIGEGLTREISATAPLDLERRVVLEDARVVNAAKLDVINWIFSAGEKA